MSLAIKSPRQAAGFAVIAAALASLSVITDISMSNFQPNDPTVSLAGIPAETAASFQHQDRSQAP